MTTSTHHTPGIDTGAVVALAQARTAFGLALTNIQVTTAMALTNWCTIEEMMQREFLGAYRGYFPKCDMTHRIDAFIAEVFDALAIELDDPRRALRCGAWTPPAPRSGGHSDG